MPIPGETREPEEGLESVLLAGRNGTASGTDGVLAFAEAAIIVPSLTTPEGPRPLILQGAGGVPLLAVFTAMDRLAPFSAGLASAQTMSGRAVLGGVQPGVGIVVNPGSGIGMEFAAAEIPRLRDSLPALPEGPGPNLPVERAILDARRGNLPHQYVMAQLAASSLYVASSSQPTASMSDIAPLVLDYNSGHYIAIFTRSDYILPFVEKSPFVMHTLVTAIAAVIVPAAGIVVNPGLDWSYLLSPEDVAGLRAAG